MKGFLKKIWDFPPSTWLIDPYYLYEYEPPKSLSDFLTTLIACIPFLCQLQSTLWLKKTQRTINKTLKELKANVLVV